MADLAKIVEDLSALTVLEAAELSKMLEEKWGVSAAAPVAVAAAGGAAPAAAAEEEKTEFDVILEDADRILRPIVTTDDVTADVCRWTVTLATALTTSRGHAMLRILTIAGVEHPDTQARLQAGFNTPLRDTVTARLIAAGWTGDAARDASDAIVGGVVYAILSEGRSFQTGRAESIARTVLSGVSAR